MVLSLFSIIILLGIIQGFILSIVIGTSKKAKAGANLFLAIFILIFTLNNLKYLINDLGLPFYSFQILFLPLSFRLLIGPSFFFYIELSLYPEKGITRNKRIIFIPPVLEFITFCILAVQSLETKQNIYTSGIYIYIDDCLEFGGVLYSLFFLIFSFKLVRNYKQNLLQNTSSSQMASLKWFQELLLLLSLTWAFWTLLTFLDIIFFPGQLNRVFFYVLWTALTIIIYWIGYKAFSEPEIFRDIVIQKDEKYKYSALTAEESISYLAKLTQAFEEESVHKNPTLTIKELATHLNVPPKHLSQLINERLGKNFFELVNYYRLEEVKKAMVAPENNKFTILALALEAGFNSKTTFNTLFKEATGLTPSAYKKQYSPKN